MEASNNQLLVQTVEIALRRVLSHSAQRLVVAGICGAQGCGKSTLSAALKVHFDKVGVPTAILSLDDLYMTREAREKLAASVHPLLLTRGVPGTHEVALGLRVIDDLEHGREPLLPRFDKASDDRTPIEVWEHAPAATRLLLLEGWCVGAQPQPDAELAAPVNRLEREEDGACIWRRYANASLAGEYQALFQRIDWLLLLAAPDFETVLGWRSEQEHHLREKVGTAAPGLMSDREIARFVQHYERLTRHILADMPERAEMVVQLAPDRSVRTVSERFRLT